MYLCAVKNYCIKVNYKYGFAFNYSIKTPNEHVRIQYLSEMNLTIWAYNYYSVCLMLWKDWRIN